MKKYLLLGILLFTSIAHAQTQALIKSTTAKVYSNPSSKSDVLVTLKKGSKVDVAGVTDSGWAKVKVTVSGFQFEGWVPKSNLSKSKAAPKAVAKPAPAPQPRVTPAPQPKMSSSSSTQLEQFFEPSGSSSNTASTPAPAPEPTRFEESKPSREKSRDTSDGDSWRAGKLVLKGSPGYMVHQYTFSDATKDAFRYNLTGLSFILGAEYKAFEFFDDLIRTSLEFQGQYAFLNTKTNLLDGTNTQFANLTASNRVMDLWLKFKLMVNFDRIMSKPFLIGTSVGYQYMKFFGDDIIDDNGVPVGLFMNQSVTSLPVGLIAELHFLDPVVLTLGTDVLIKNKVSESGEGDPPITSGSNPMAKMGFAPYLKIDFPLTGPHFMGIHYQYRLQKTNFTGQSSSRVNNELNEATAMQSFHTLGLEYAYHF